MKLKLSRYAVLGLTIFCMAAYIPEFFLKMFPVKQPYNFTNYSPIIHDFVHAQFSFDGKNKETVFKDSAGNLLNRKQIAHLLPFRHVRDLAKWGQLPETINGQPVSYRSILRGSQYEQHRPKFLPANHAQVQLFPMFETASDFSRLQFPKDVFRMTDRIEFINADTNTIDEQKSEKFTRALKKQNFVFPARLVASGEPTCLKNFDEGFLMVDHDGKLFHIKQVRKQPYIKQITLPEGVAVKSLSVIEHDRRELLGYLISTKNEIYQLQYRGYQLIKLPLEHFNPETMRLLIRYTPQFASATYHDEWNKYITVMDKSYQVIKTYHEALKNSSHTTIFKIAEMLFPFSVDVYSSKTQYYRLELNGDIQKALIGIMVCLVLGLLLMRWRGISIQHNKLDLLLILCTGFYGLIATQLMPPEDWE